METVPTPCPGPRLTFASLYTTSCIWSHDKDYRTLAAFLADDLLEYTLHVVRMTSDQDLTTELIIGALSSDLPRSISWSIRDICASWYQGKQNDTPQ